jgi:hypothetical protein
MRPGRPRWRLRCLHAPFGLSSAALALAVAIATLPLLRPRGFFLPAFAFVRPLGSHTPRRPCGLALSSFFGRGRFFGLGLLSSGLRPASSSGRPWEQGCIFERFTSSRMAKDYEARYRELVARVRGRPEAADVERLRGQVVESANNEARMKSIF